ncbi:MAG: hypothetical protein ACU0DI_16185 [Paracoccaceae bacterium]
MGMTLLTAEPAFANHGDGEDAHGNQANEPKNNGKGSNNSNGKGRNSGTDDDSSELKPNSSRRQDEPTDEESPSASTGDEPLVFFTSFGSGSSLRAKMRRAQKELARLFALNDQEIATEFPDGGYEDALMQAAALARKAERVYRKKHG